MRLSSITLLASLLLFSSCRSTQAAAPEADAKKIEYFEKSVRPLLVAKCYECHSKETETSEGNLFLDSRAGWAIGGDLGPAITPGDPDKSLIIKAVRYKHQELQMPPEGKLSDSEIAVLENWVKMGAPDPRLDETAPAPKKTVDLDEGRKFWSFQKPLDPPVPAVKNTAWPKSDLDRFVLAALETKGLTPAKPADKRTLIRRATFDLTGMPPTPEEIDAFLNDPSDDAFAKVVERLLASPRYGERWGRHWLDVARYSDSNGLDENVAHGNAWRYRDYVIASLNKDKPYDQFLIEQLAGDLLPPVDDLATTHERLIATGFLSLGPKVLAEVDENKMEMDIVDEQIDTVGKAFLGLTLGCARCHDHKFDPIRSEDYYGLAGIFKSTKTMESFTKLAKWNENEVATKQDVERKKASDLKIAEHKAAIAKVVDEANKALLTTLAAGAKLPADAEKKYPAETQKKLTEMRALLKQLEKDAYVLPTAMGVADGKVVDVPIHIRGSHLTLGEVAPRTAPAVLSFGSEPSFSKSSSGRLELAQWMANKDHPLTSRVMVNRIWRWHFGKGLVPSADNFGVLGSRPTNQLLLDWLSRRFVAEGWSLKAMHRKIMLSSTYQMSSEFDSKAAAVDPENLLHWRFDIRRLESEAIRDSILAVSGLLDPTMGGSMLHVKNREFFFDHTSTDRTKYDSPRRSIYLPVVRNNLYDMFDLFDSTNATVPNGDRSTTTVAPQALFMLNSSLVADAAQKMAKDVLANGSMDDAKRLERLYLLAYGRTPSERESERALSYLKRFEQAAGKPDANQQREVAWTNLCQVLVAASEFIHLR